MLGLLGVTFATATLFITPIILINEARRTPRLNVYELIRLAEGNHVATTATTFQRWQTTKPPAPSETDAELIIASLIAHALKKDDGAVRIHLDRDDRDNGPAYRRRLELYGDDYASYLQIDGAFLMAVKMSNGEWMIISHQTPPFLRYFGISALKITSLIILSFLFMYFASRIILPLEKLAKSASNIGGDLNISPVPVRGPTEIREAAMAFNQMRHQIDSLFKQRTTMLLAIAHDLRTPLARIKFQSRIGSDKSYEAIQDEIDHMQRLIGSTLQFAEGQAHRAHFEKLDFPSLIESCAENFTDAGFFVDFHCADGFTLIGDRLLLKRMIENIIDNSLKYGTKATVSVSKSDDRAIIEISDDGPGMTEDQMARVFEPFYRGDTSRSSGEGAGLGLAIVDLAVRAHKGQIILTSPISGGLSARVELPIGD